MSCYDYETLKEHVGHDVQCVRYSEDNVTVECYTCHVVIVTHELYPRKCEELTKLTTSAPEEVER